MIPDPQPVADSMRHAWTGPISYADPGAFAPIAAGTLPTFGTGPGVVREAPFTERKFLRYAPEFVDDPSGSGLFSHIGASVYVSPPAFVAAADSAALVGYRTIIADGHFFNDELYSAERRDGYITRLSQSDPFPNEDTRLRRHADTFLLEQSGQHWRRFEGTTIVLCSAEPSNYGSFLFRVLPKIFALRQLGLTDLPVVCWNIRPATSALLELVGLNPNQIISHDTNSVTVFDRAIVPSLRNPNALLDHESREVYRQIRNREGFPSGKRRLYISRLAHGMRQGSSRVMQNEADLIARLSSIGFEIVEPEKLSIRQQIATFASAEIVVGPSGAGMFNVVFCQPGTKVIDIESETNWIYAHAGLFASCELRYGIFTGQVDATDTTSVHRRWTVDVDALVDRTRRFLDA